MITIIAILAGLAFPAMTGALEAAKKAEATAMCTQLKTALTSYLTEYGAWSGVLDTSGEITSDTNALAELLLGESTGSPDPNPRKIVFMEFNEKSLEDRSDATQGFLDPWGQPYSIKVDHDYNNQIAAPTDVNPDGQDPIRTTAIIWSDGKDGEFNSARDPKSW